MLNVAGALLSGVLMLNVAGALVPSSLLAVLWPGEATVVGVEVDTAAVA
jgi:hypothetical protein